MARGYMGSAESRGLPGRVRTLVVYVPPSLARFVSLLNYTQHPQKQKKRECELHATQEQNPRPSQGHLDEPHNLDSFFLQQITS